MKPDSFDIANDGNLFPREDLLEAVARSDWRDREVPAIAWILTGVGLSLLAAGLPVALEADKPLRMIVRPAAP